MLATVYLCIALPLTLPAATIGLLAAEYLPGQAFFDSAGCKACHRIGDAGGNSGPDLSLVGFRHNREWLNLWLKDPKAWNKDTLMPNFRLPEKTREAVVDYLASLQGGALGNSARGQLSPKYIFGGAFQESGAPWDAAEFRANPAARGHILYVRAGCVACHGIRGIGGHPNNNTFGNSIPALNNVSQSYTQSELIAKIRRGSKPIKTNIQEPDPFVVMPEWGKILRDDDIRDVAAYLLTLNSEPKQGSDF